MKRDLGKADEIFDVPAINYFTSGNDYFGSFKDKFRYRISLSDETVSGEVWNDDVCYGKAEVTEKKSDFSMTPEGITDCIKWLFECCERIYGDNL